MPVNRINRGSLGTCASGVFLSCSNTFDAGCGGGGSGYDIVDMEDEEEDLVSFWESSSSAAEDEEALSPLSVSGGVSGISPPTRRGIGAFAESVGIDDLVSVDGVGRSPWVWLSSSCLLSMMRKIRVWDGAFAEKATDMGRVLTGLCPLRSVALCRSGLLSVEVG